MHTDRQSSFLAEPLETCAAIPTGARSALVSAGLRAVGDLYRFGYHRIAARCQVDERTAIKWLAVVTLGQIQGMTAEVAGELIDARLVTAADIADAGLRTLQKAVGSLSAYKLADLQKHAMSARGMGILVCCVLDAATRRAYAGVEVRLDSRTAETDTDGRCAFARIPAGLHTVEFAIPGRMAIRRPMRIRRGIPKNELRVLMPSLRPLPSMRRPPSALVACGPGVRPALAVVPLQDVPSGTYLCVSPRSTRDNTRLVSLARSRVPNQIRNYVVDGVPPELLGGPVKPHTILQYRDGRLLTTELTVRQAVEAAVDGIVRLPRQDRVRRIPAPIAPGGPQL